MLSIAVIDIKLYALVFLISIETAKSFIETFMCLSMGLIGSGNVGLRYGY